jgi:hypothetical protein
MPVGKTGWTHLNRSVPILQSGLLARIIITSSREQATGKPVLGKVQSPTVNNAMTDCKGKKDLGCNMAGTKKQWMHK